MKYNTTPILYIIFNRLDLLKKSFAVLKKLKPITLYIACDGARKSKEGEQEKVLKVRDYVLKNIDWKCDVKTRFMDENLGCGKHVSSAITWFFSSVPKGIIMEDDLIPHPSFFRFCYEMLDKYKENKQIMCICGTNFAEKSKINTDYFFGKSMACWGWATWADRWLENFDLALNGWTEQDVEYLDNQEFKHYGKLLKQLQNNELDTWDYQWSICCAKRDGGGTRGLVILPRLNMVKNIGINGSHMNSQMVAQTLFMPTYNLYELGELRHPALIEYDARTSLFCNANEVVKSLTFKKHKCLFRFNSEITFKQRMVKIIIFFIPSKRIRHLWREKYGLSKMR